MKSRIRWAPKVPLAAIARVYADDADGRPDDELLDDVGWRLLARCQDVLLVSSSRVVCVCCGDTFDVPWISEPPDRVSECWRCGWSITAGEYHASFEHQDVSGGGGRDAFERFVSTFPKLRTAGEKMAAIDRLLHAVHTTGGLAARNLIEGRARKTLAALDAIANARVSGREFVEQVVHAGG